MAVAGIVAGALVVAFELADVFLTVLLQAASHDLGLDPALVYEDPQRMRF